MRKFNVNEFISLLILILILSLVSFLMITGDIYNFLSEKSAKNLNIVLIVLPILIIVQIAKVFTFNSRDDVSIKFLPIVITLVVSVLLVFRSHNIDEEVNGNNFNNVISHNAIEINHETHYILEELEERGEEFLGKYIIFTGFVYKYEGDKFILAREEMNCCAADSFIIGVKSMADEKFQEGQWVKVLGKIEYNGEYYLNINEYIKISEPKNVYF
ncbi:membrane-spanning protein [Clostridium tertium]|uniref:DUF1980 domain-containing protein n=1 Tax=Clostridium tertium TaxID=1559 RepID=A0A6N3EJ14_9CLOT